MKLAAAFFFSAVAATSAQAAEVNIVCNWTHSVSDRPDHNGATSGSFTAIIDEVNTSITINHYCQNGVLDRFDANEIVVSCSDEIIKSTYKFDRISGGVTFFMSGSKGGFLMHYGQCYATQKKF